MRFPKILAITVLVFGCTVAHAQRSLKGNWITPAHEMICITDTTGVKYTNYLVNGISHDQNFYLLIAGDTLSFRMKYTSSRDSFRVQHIDRYDLKIISHTDSLLVVSPASSFSKKYFRDQQQLSFRRQDYTVDSTIHLEKIIFHTTKCYGTCNVYHLQVNQSGAFLLHRDFIYDQQTGYEDSTARGYFTGKLPDSLFQPLLHALRTIDLPNLKMDTILCCDAVVKTIIIYYNGKRKYYKTMFPPKMTDRLILALYEICAKSVGLGIDEAFKLEE